MGVLMDYKYKCGLYVGRFQPIHDGHCNVICAMLKDCAEVIIAVGSAQKCGTLENPFSYSTRAMLIYDSFALCSDRLHIVPIFDREHPSNDSSWGEYLMSNVLRLTGRMPDAVFEGAEDERASWYDTCSVDIIRIDRDELPISGTQIRADMLADNFDAVKACVPLSVASLYGNLRKELLLCSQKPSI